MGFINFATQCMVIFSVLLAAFVINGDWLVVTVHLLKQMNALPNDTNASKNSFDEALAKFYLKDVSQFWISAMISGFGIYFCMGGFLHYYYYVWKRDHPELWKCQPERWLSTELELDEIKYGCRSLLVTNTWSALIACYIRNGGYSTVYYDVDTYGWLWFFLQWPAIFLYQDYITYWMHRWFHMPYLYQRFHKRHHRYKQPTAFSVTAIHPVEITAMQLVLTVPLFTFPVHWVAFYVIALYTYYHGIVTHSGINLKAHWWQPWQPDAVFHDNHHQYVHVNFGFNCYYWDMIHDTYRKPDRVYNENIYYGRGKSITEISKEELQRELNERLTETKTAYNENNNPYLFEADKDKLFSRHLCCSE